MAKKKDNAADKEKSSFFEEIGKKFKQSPGIYIGSVVILVLVVVTFLGGDLLSGGRFGGSGDDLTFGYYDRTPITYVPGNFLARNYNSIYNYYQSQGVDVSDFWTSAQMWRLAFEGALAHTAILEIMARSGYTVPDRFVDREVAKLAQFQDSGRFSEALFRATPESTRSALWRQEQESLIKNMFIYDYFSLMNPKGEAAFIANMATPIRVYEMVSFSINDYPDSEYLSFARGNSTLFNSIHLSKITISSSEREARRVLASIMDGTTTFEDAARNQSSDQVYAATGGDMGNRYYFELENDIPNTSDRNAIFNLRAGEISDIIVTSNGWSFFRIENAARTADFNDETVMDRVKLYVRGYERGRMDDWTISRARDFIAEARISGYEETALAWELERDVFGPLAVNYGDTDLFTPLNNFSVNNIDNSQFAALSRNENFWRTILSALYNDFSEPFVSGSDILVFIPTEETDTDEAFINNLETMFSSWWLAYVSEQIIQQYFVNSERAGDPSIFWNAFFQYFMPF
ncbi:MAG: peptidylprolyl isomerase [Treponema sp.]|nr:peptidylprolyl isomerase [Treponema sp.]